MKKKPRSVAIKIRLSVAELRELRRWANIQELTVSEFVRRMFSNHRRAVADAMATQIVERSAEAIAVTDVATARRAA